jgi:hypothetical protein
VNEDLEPGGIGIGRQPDAARAGAGPARGRVDLPSEADDLVERVRRAREQAANAAAIALPRGQSTPHSARHVRWWTGLIQRWLLLPHPVEERAAGQQVPGKRAPTRSSRAFSDKSRAPSPSSQLGRLSFGRAEDRGARGLRRASHPVCLARVVPLRLRDVVNLVTRAATIAARLAPSAPTTPEALPPPGVGAAEASRSTNASSASEPNRTGEARSPAFTAGVRKAGRPRRARRRGRP